MSNFYLNDASLFASLARRTADINAQAMEAVLPDIYYPEVIPVNTDYADWQAEGWAGEYRFAGEANWFDTASDDLPKVALSATSQVFNFSEFGVGYSWDRAEIGKASAAGVNNLNGMKARAARESSEKFVQNIALNGDARKGYLGIINQTGITTETAATAWVNATTGALTATPDQIFADIQFLVDGPIVGAPEGLIRADVIGVPGIVYRALQRVPFDPLVTGRMTAFDYIETTLGVRILKLDTANATRAVGYRRDMSVLELPMPIPYGLDTGYQFGPYKWNVPGLGRIGGVQVHKKDGMRYLDGVAA